MPICRLSCRTQESYAFRMLFINNRPACSRPASYWAAVVLC
jgi:hypothetical protein